MSQKEKEYKELFISEAFSSLEELNKLLTFLEKNPQDKRSIDTIFRLTHTLKGNAAGLGFELIAKFSHVLEDLFALIKEGKLSLDEQIFSVLYKSFDVLTELTTAIDDPQKVVRYRGVQRKLEVLIERLAPALEEEAAGALQDKQGKTSPSKKATVKEPPSAAEATGENCLLPEASPAEPASGAAIVEAPGASNIPAAVEQAYEEESRKIIFSDLVQVPVGKLDNLLNLVGELLIERDRLIANNEQAQMRNEFSRLNRISSDLQYSVMDVRLVQVGFLFNKFYRVVRDAAKAEQKEVELLIEGSDTEIDRNILQIISDSLIHLIRNAVGHGLESPEERKKRHKQPIGQLKLAARNESDGVLIEIQDDGKGIDLQRVARKVVEKGWLTPTQAASLSEEEIISFIFQPGFSTAEQVNNISGRGVGMDVVKKALDSIGGNIKVRTQKGIGTTFSLILPSSMAVKGTLLFEIEDTQYAIPLAYTESVLAVPRQEVRKMQNRMMIRHLDKTVEAIYLKDLLFKDAQQAAAAPETDKLHVIIVEYSGRTLGLIVDRLLQQKEIVEKPLRKPVEAVSFISGVTIMGNGNVCLVINVPQIIQRRFNYSAHITNQVLS